MISLTELKRAAEVWKDIPGFENEYQVSNLGRVRSILFCKPKWHRPARPPRILRSNTNRSGYPGVMLHARINKHIHALVLTAFVGKRPKGMVCAHLDGSRDNNRIENLRWVTESENQKHRDMHGTQNRGEKSANAVATNAQVLKIRDLAKSGVPQAEISRRYGFSTTLVNCIVLRKTWTHI